MDRLLKQYEIGPTLGTGAFSEVKQATDKATGQKFAIKVIDRAKCSGKESMIMSEVSILKRVKHENIISLIDMFETETKIYLVMELVTGGELFDRIVERGHYSENDAAKIVQRILSAVDYLHELGIAHRDLKPENLMFSDNTPKSKIMIGDFGLSKIFNEEEVMKTACGTPGYVAPEVLKRQGYSSAVDLWSIGVITYILLVGYPPFYEENNVELFGVIMRGEYEFDSPYWDNISRDAKDFISKLLVVDPTKRLDAKGAMKHPFIAKRCPPLQTSTSSATTPSTVPAKKNSNPEEDLGGSIYASGSVESLQSGIGEDDDPPSGSSSIGDKEKTPLERTDTAIGPTSATSSTVSADRQATALNLVQMVERASISEGTASRSVNSSVNKGAIPSTLEKGGNLRILSYNLCIRPPLVKANYSDYKDVRLQIFCDSYLNNYDILILQEVYARGSTRQKKLVNTARKLGFEHYLRSPSHGLLKGIVDGGLVILSRYPIVSSSRMTFEKGVNTDRFLAKGAIFARIQVSRTHHFDIFNTHLQSAFSSNSSDPNDPCFQARKKQISQFRDFITASLESPNDDNSPSKADSKGSVIITGDFNVNARAGNNGQGHSEEYKDLLSTVKASNPSALAALEDNVFTRYKSHPVTFGAGAGQEEKAETLLTEKIYQGTNQCTNHFFSTPSAGVKLEEISVNSFSMEGQEFTHLSDHYGIVAKYNIAPAK